MTRISNHGDKGWGGFIVLCVVQQGIGALLLFLLLFGLRNRFRLK